MNLHTIELTDSVIILKPFIDLNYAETQLKNEDEAHEKWLSGEKSTLEGIQNWIKKNQQYWEEDGPVYAFAVFLHGDNTLIGMVETNMDRENVKELQEGDTNVSYSLYPFTRGKGYATRAVNLAMQFLKTKGVKRAMIRIEPDNTVSLKVPEHCGFTKEKIITTNENKQLVIFTKLIE